MDESFVRNRRPETENCLFCFTPVEINSRRKKTDEQTVDHYDDIITCSKELLHGKIRKTFSEENYPSESLSTICLQCFNSAEKIHKVNQKLIEIGLLLDSLIEEFTIEINERHFILSENGYPLKEIKVEDDTVTVEEDIHFIEEEISFNDSPLPKILNTKPIFSTDSNFVGDKEDDCVLRSSSGKGKNRKSVLVPRVDLDDTDSHISDGQKDLATADASQNLETEEFVAPSSHFLNDRKSDETNNDPLKSKGEAYGADCASNYYPRVLLDKLEIDSSGQVIDPRKGRSRFCKRKSTVAAVGNLRKTAKSANSEDLSVDFLPPIKWNNSSRESMSSSVLMTDSVNVINLPVTTEELLNLVCNTCKKEFSELQNLVNHKQSPCSGSYVLKTPNFEDSVPVRKLGRPAKTKKESDSVCDICGRPDIRRMKEHLVTHFGEHELPFRCTTCGRGFKFKKFLKDHVAIVHTTEGEEGSFICNVCGKKWKTKFRLAHHVGQVHKNFSCSLCEETFKCRMSLIRHENSHNGKEFPCDKCGKTCLSQSDLKQHRRRYHSIHGIIKRQYICQESGCKKSFTSHSSFKIHSAKHEGTEKEFQCAVCKKKLLSEQGFNLHMKNHGEKKFVCEICGGQFATSRALRFHSQLHEEGDFECPICRKKINNSQRLRQHIALVHNRQKNHVCDKCGFRSKFNNTLQQHIRSVHEKALPFNCSTCGKGFSQRVNCLKHENTHKNKKERTDEYKCQICGNRQLKSSTLKMHQILFHSAYTKQKSHCDKCGNTFSNGLELYKHNRVRNWDPNKAKRNNPAKCVYCHEIFESRCEVLIHIVSHHQDEKIPYECEMCGLILNNPSVLKNHVNNECGMSSPLRKY